MANDLFGDWLSARRTVDAILYQSAAQYKMDPRNFCRQFVEITLDGAAHYTAHPDRQDVVLPVGHPLFAANPKQLPTGHDQPPASSECTDESAALSEVNALRAIALFAYRASAVNESARLYVATRLSDYPVEKTGALVRALKCPVVTDEMLRQMFAVDELRKRNQ